MTPALRKSTSSRYSVASNVDMAGLRLASEERSAIKGRREPLEEGWVLVMVVVAVVNWEGVRVPM